MHRGYIKLWRLSVDNKDYLSEPFTRWQAWIDLLLLANHKPNRIYIRGISVEVGVGELVASEEFLSIRWRWSRNKVRRYIVLLSSKTKQQIIVKRNNKITTISIVNWNTYQGNDTTKSTTNDTTERQQKDIPKNDKNVKNVKNKEIYKEKFDTFWEAYPKKVDKQDAIKIFNSMKPTQGFLDMLLKSIAQQKLSDQWKNNYIKSPARWLRGQHWGDELKGGNGGKSEKTHHYEKPEDHWK